MPQAAIRQYQYEEDDQLQALDVDQQAVSTEEIDETVQSDDSSAPKNEHEEIVYKYTLDTENPEPWLVTHRKKLIFLALVIVAGLVGNYFFKQYQQTAKTKAIVASPQLNDFYFVDFRVIKDNLRPSEKFRMAKVYDITGDVVTLNFSSYFYTQENELNDAIRYGQLRSEKFFQEKRHNYKISELEQMIDTGAILIARRPTGNMLDGNIVVPDSNFDSHSVFLPGNKENLTGLEFMKISSGDPDILKLAVKKFQESAKEQFPPGQVNLAELYLTGTGVEKDLTKSLELLKNASLQAHEPAILKFAIVCEQVEACATDKFYKELVNAGVNIEFTKQANVRATTKVLSGTFKN